MSFLVSSYRGIHALAPAGLNETGILFEIEQAYNSDPSKVIEILYSCKDEEANPIITRLGGKKLASLFSDIPIFDDFDFKCRNLRKKLIHWINCLSKEEKNIFARNLNSKWAKYVFTIDFVPRLHFDPDLLNIFDDLEDEFIVNIFSDNSDEYSGFSIPPEYINNLSDMQKSIKILHLLMNTHPDRFLYYLSQNHYIEEHIKAKYNYKTLIADVFSKKPGDTAKFVNFCWEKNIATFKSVSDLMAETTQPSTAAEIFTKSYYECFENILFRFFLSGEATKNILKEIPCAFYCNHLRYSSVQEITDYIDKCLSKYYDDIYIENFICGIEQLKFQELEEKGIVNLLNYSDVDPEILKTGRMHINTFNYAFCLQLLFDKYGKIKVMRKAHELRKNMLIALSKLNIKPSKYAKSLSWALWDMSKQYYYFVNQSEAHEKYLIADPMKSESKQKEIVNRHLGWEVYTYFHFTNPDDLYNFPFSDKIDNYIEKPPNDSDSLSSYDLAILGKLIKRHLFMKRFSLINIGRSL